MGIEETKVETIVIDQIIIILMEIGEGINGCH